MPYKNNKDKLINLQRRRDIVWGYFVEYRKMCKCTMCGESHWAVLDFHHVDPTTKKSGVPEVAQKGTLGQLKRELAKCVVLCSNCHRKLHVLGEAAIKVIVGNGARAYVEKEQMCFLDQLGGV